MGNRGWDKTYVNDSIHIHPHRDIYDHELHRVGDCMCNPTVEYDDPDTLQHYAYPLVIHNSFDGRELNE